MPDAIVVTGATGTGKTGLGLRLAERLRGEIISADSRQVYRGMDIGTAKPPAEARERVPHHGLDVVDPDERYSAGRFARDAHAWLADIRDRERVPIVVGGSGFFIRALLRPLAPIPRFGTERRDDLRRYLNRQPSERLDRWLRRLDPERAEQLASAGGRQRRSRALEVALLSGRPQSWWFERPPGYPPLKALPVCLGLPREELYRRLDRRFEDMMAAGLLSEVRRLLDRYSAEAPGFNTVGYAELIEHLEGGIGLDEAVARAKRNTRRFARRQLTWFRHQLPEEAIRIAASGAAGPLIEEVIESWEAMRRSGPGSRRVRPIASSD